MYVGGPFHLDLPYDSADDGDSAAHGADDEIDVGISVPSPFACIVVGGLRHSSSYSVPDLDFDYTSHTDYVSLPVRQANVKETVCHWGKQLAHRSQESYFEPNAVGGGSAGCIADGRSAQSLVAGIDIQVLPSDVTGSTPVNTNCPDFRD